jgi:hypothetical protein
MASVAKRDRKSQARTAERCRQVGPSESSSQDDDPSKAVPYRLNARVQHVRLLLTWRVDLANLPIQI